MNHLSPDHTETKTDEIIRRLNEADEAIDEHTRGIDESQARRVALLADVPDEQRPADLRTFATAAGRDHCQGDRTEGNIAYRRELENSLCMEPGELDEVTDLK